MKVQTDLKAGCLCDVEVNVNVNVDVDVNINSCCDSCYEKQAC